MRLVNKKHYIIAISQSVSIQRTGQQASFTGRIASIGGDRMKRLFLLLVLLAFVGAASATDYYLATTGDNNNTGLSIAQAWKDPSYADDQLYAGDTLWVVDGIYWEDDTFYMTSSHLGTSDNWVNIKAYNGTPIWDGSNATIKWGFSMSLATPYTPAYLKIDGITIRSYRDGIFCADNVSDFIIVNCTFRDTNIAEDWRSLASIGGGVRNVTIHNCDFIDTSNFCLNMIGDRWGITRRMYNVTITDCFFNNTTNHGAIQFSDYCSDITVSDSIFDTCYSGVGTYYHEIDTNYNRTYNVLYKNNSFINITYYPMSLMGTVNSSIEDNIVYDAGKSAFCSYGYCNNVTIKNNIVSDSLRLHDDYLSTNSNILVKYKNNTYTNLDSIDTYYIRGGGALIIIDDIHQPSFRVAMRNDDIIGNTTIEYLDGKVFNYSIIVGSTYSITEPRWFSEKSNMTFGSSIGVDIDIDIIPYNITLLPMNAYLKNVTVHHDSLPADDRTNIIVNSSVSSNPTWINATMQNASNTYNVSIDGSYVTQVVSDSDKVVRYQYTGSWSSHDFEFDWSGGSSSWSPSSFGNYYNATDQIKITVKGYGNGSHIFSRSLQQSDNNASSFKIMVKTT